MIVNENALISPLNNDSLALQTFKKLNESFIEQQNKTLEPLRKLAMNTKEWVKPFESFHKVMLKTIKRDDFYLKAFKKITGKDLEEYPQLMNCYWVDVIKIIESLLLKKKQNKEYLEVSIENDSGRFDKIRIEILKTITEFFKKANKQIENKKTTKIFFNKLKLKIKKINDSFNLIFYQHLQLQLTSTNFRYSK